MDISECTTVDTALVHFFKKEKIEYTCDACAEKMIAVKQLSIEKGPEVLCIQLKRFINADEKINKHVSFKQIIHMTPFAANDNNLGNRLLYKLSSAIIHSGSSAKNGHYTCIAQVSNEKYYSFDDSTVGSKNIQ